ncbi:MAG: DegV family protein [Bacteroidales bacterium]|nr:DegV family protein [Anaerotignum sp.]MCI5680053.1 DegV family protein [Bacteroidales bacterium]MDY3926785.1 DegV family protein [Anaerotignum sp.]
MKKILVDSGCDLMCIETMAEGIVYDRVPLKILMGDKEFVDDETLDVAQMVEEMYTYQGKTSSACPSPEEWAAHFRDAEESYAITITGALSGSHNSAMVAKHMVEEEDPSKKIYVLDSLSAGGEMTLLAQKLHELLQADVPFEEVCRQMDAYSRDHTRLVFVLYSIENLVKNGRVSKIAGMAAGLLNLSIVAKATEKGEIGPIGKARGKKKGARLVLEEMEQQGYRGGKVILSHCQNLDGVEMIKETISEKYENVVFESMETRGLCSYYAERNGLMIGYEV